MIKNFYISLISCFLLVGVIHAQQKPLYSHYMFNKMAINPGSAGSADMVSMTGVFRQQWMGIDGAPSTGSFNVNSPLNLFGISSGIGVDLLRDAIGLQSDIGIKLAYAFRFNAGDGKMGIGVSGGVYSPSATYSKFADEDPAIANTLFQDGAIPTSDMEGVVTADIDFGIYYRTEDLFIGLSSTRVNASSVPYSKESTGTTITGEYQYARHYYLNSGYNLQLANPSYMVKPSFLIQSDAKSTTFDANIMLEYNKKVWGGVSYRLGIANMVIAMFGLEMGNGVKIGFAYDVPSISLLNYTSGTIEFMMGYDFSLKVDKLPQRYKSIRYL